MSYVILSGDANDGGGVAASTSTLTVNSSPVVLAGDLVSDHPAPDGSVHSGATTTTTTSILTVNGIGVTRVGDPDTCGHTRSLTSNNILNVG